VDGDVEGFLAMAPSNFHSGTTNKSPVFAATMLLAAAFAIPAGAGGLVRIGFCLPGSTRFTKCIDGKLAECTRSRNVKCKTRQSCRPTEQSCEAMVLPR
jgi:hypothetical protein